MASPIRGDAATPGLIGCGGTLIGALSLLLNITCVDCRKIAGKLKNGNVSISPEKAASLEKQYLHYFIWPRGGNF